MAKRKPVESGEAAPAVVEVKKPARKATAKSTSVAASPVHKHHAKKNPEPMEAPVVVSAPVITHEAIAQLAYSFWDARGFQGGSPEQDWLRAEQELLKLS